MKHRIITVGGLLWALGCSAVYAVEPAKSAIVAPKPAVTKPATAAPATTKPVVVTVTKTSPAIVGPVVRCYNPQQYRAEQAIRYHTQLMVAGMLCQNHPGPQVYSQYQGFTLRNQAVITRAENKLIEFFRLQRKPAPERELHSLRTNMANEISMRAMQQSLANYCRTAAPRVKQASMMQSRQFENYLTKLDLKQTSTVPLCNQAPTLQQIKATVPVQEMVAPKQDGKAIKPVEKTGKK